MKPILYESTETAFDTNGLGVLADAARCLVTEERNGSFELELDYPVAGIHYGSLALRALILAAPNPTDEPQPFRVYRISRPMDGLVTVYAQHLSYDLAGIPAAPFTAISAPAAMAALKTAAAVDCPFEFWTDKETAATMTVAAPASIRSLLGGSQGSILDTYGGEYAFDRYTVRLYGRRGADRGVSIRYGKNLTSLQQEENCAAVYTGAYPFWTGQDGALVQLPEKVLPAPGSYDFTRILALDLSQEWQDPPTAEQLRTRAQQYMRENEIGTPKVSLEVEFAQLEQTEEYKDLALLERVELGDTVSVEFAALGVSASARVVKTVYDPLRGRYDSIELGDTRANIADTIAAQQQAIKEAPSKSYLQQAVAGATAQITGNLGGYVVLHSSTGGPQPDEILIMDQPSIEAAVKVWRWNKAGLGYSSSGYNGPYGLAMTADGQIVADFITTGTLNAAEVKVVNLVADQVRSTSGDLLMSLWAGILSMYDANRMRMRLYTAATDPSYGIFQLFQGNVDEQANLLDTNARRTTIAPWGATFGIDKDGRVLGDMHFGGAHLHTGNLWFGENPEFRGLWISDGGLVVDQLGSVWVKTPAGNLGGAVEWKTVSTPGGGMASALCLK